MRTIFRGEVAYKVNGLPYLLCKDCKEGNHEKVNRQRFDLLNMESQPFICKVVSEITESQIGGGHD
jgi:hypothetical protein